MEAGFSRPSVVLAIALTAMFNYLTRVADAVGVEADYESSLPRFVYRDLTESAPRPPRQEWPPVDRSIEFLSTLPDVAAAWGRWRDYILESPDPIPVATRQRLRSIAARAACDGTLAPADDTGSDGAVSSRTGSGQPLAEFAEKLSRTPWLMTQTDVDALRSTGLDDLSVLHVIAVVAYQSAESRLRIGLSALARCED
jgi:hypothetical protein